MAMNAAIPDRRPAAIDVADPNGRQPPAYAYAPNELNLAQIVRFFLRHWHLICGTALAAGLTAALSTALFVPRSYEASATLVIVPPKLSSELKPPTLTVQGYQKLLESDAVLAEAKKRLVQQGVLAEEGTLHLGTGVETRIFVSRQSETVSLAPMLQTVARGKSPEQAAAIANMWVQVFLERTHELMAGTTSASVRFIDAQYPQARDLLAQLENERLQTAHEFQKRYDEASTRWDKDVLAFKSETQDLVAAYQAETTRLVGEFSNQRTLEVGKPGQEVEQKSAGALQNEQVRSDSLLQEKFQQLVAILRQLAQTAPYLTLEKSITEDALWESLALQKLESLQGRSLRTQEVNPLYTELSSRLSQIEMEISTLSPRSSQFVQEFSADLEKLRRKREAGMSQLKEQRNTELAIREREKKRELDTIARERDTRLAQSDRNIAQQKGLYDELTKNYNQATLAKAQQEIEDVRLGATAVPPDRPAPRGLATKSLLALVVGGVLGVVIAVISDAVATAESGTSLLDTSESRARRMEQI